MQERDRSFRKATKSNSPSDWSKYKSLKSHVNRQVKKSKSEYYLNLIEISKNNPNTLCKHLNEITSRKSSSNISCIEVDGTPSTKPRQISEILNNHFSTIGLTLVNKFRTVTSTITSAVYKDHLESGVMFAFDVIDEFLLNPN